MYAVHFCNILHAHLLLMNLQTNGATPLFIAAQEGHDTIVAALLSHPAVDVNKAKVCTPCMSLELIFDLRIRVVLYGLCCHMVLCMRYIFVLFCMPICC